MEKKIKMLQVFSLLVRFFDSVTSYPEELLEL